MEQTKQKPKLKAEEFKVIQQLPLGSRMSTSSAQIGQLAEHLRRDPKADISRICGDEEEYRGYGHGV